MPPRSRLSTRSVLEIATQAAKPARAKPRHLEAQQQRMFVQRWRLDPRTRHLPACAIPNGGRRDAREGAMLKAEGVSAGAPDWVCFTPNISYHGLALEFKSPDLSGRLTEAQSLWHQHLRQCHWRVEVVTSADEAWRIVSTYLGFTR